MRKDLSFLFYSPYSCEGKLLASVAYSVSSSSQGKKRHMRQRERKGKETDTPPLSISWATFLCP